MNWVVLHTFEVWFVLCAVGVPAFMVYRKERWRSRAAKMARSNASGGAA